MCAQEHEIDTNACADAGTIHTRARDKIRIRIKLTGTAVVHMAYRCQHFFHREKSRGVSCLHNGYQYEYNSDSIEHIDPVQL